MVGGRLFAVIGSPPIMEARLVTRTGENSWLSEALFETCIDALELPAPVPRFQF
jgi:protein-L-isoaspartate(D-aspartate) O-methyltransferase